LSLPIRTTLEDVNAVCGYLASKPTGATLAEAKAILDKKHLDGRKLSALRLWGLIEENGDKFRLTELGRQLTKDKGARRSQALREALNTVVPYRAMIERAVHRKEFTVTSTEVAEHWHRHFKDESSDNENTLNDQAVCFFQLAQGADLGTLVIGRKGQPTRFEFQPDNAEQFVHGQFSHPIFNDDSPILFEPKESEPRAVPEQLSNPTMVAPAAFAAPVVEPQVLPKAPLGVNRVFITHGKNRKILDQVKEIVSFGKFEPVVAQERETAAKPVPEKVMDEMRGCQAAVIHVGAEQILLDREGNEHPQINGNVLIEIGAAMALYGRNFILVVEDGVKLPSNLQGLYECRYNGNELNMEATMKLLKAFNQFSQQS